MFQLAQVVPQKTTHLSHNHLCMVAELGAGAGGKSEEDSRGQVNERGNKYRDKEQDFGYHGRHFVFDWWGY